MLLSLVLAIWSSSAVNAAFELPNYFPRCYQDDPEINKCMLKASHDLRPYVQKGINELELPSFEPVVLPPFNVTQNVPQMNIELVFSNMTFHNMYEYDLDNIEFHPRDVILRGDLKFHHLPMTADYIVDGTLIGFPVKGNGTFDGHLSQLEAIFEFSGNLIKRKGVEYCNITNVHIDLNITDVEAHITGLIGDGGAFTNDLFNQFSELMATVGSPVIAEIFESFVTPYVIKFCKKIPYNDIFPLSLNN